MWITMLSSSIMTNNSLFRETPNMYFPDVSTVPIINTYLCERQLFQILRDPHAQLASLIYI